MNIFAPYFCSVEDGRVIVNEDMSIEIEKIFTYTGKEPLRINHMNFSIPKFLISAHLNEKNYVLEKVDFYLSSAKPKEIIIFRIVPIGNSVQKLTIKCKIGWQERSVVLYEPKS